MSRRAAGNTSTRYKIGNRNWLRAASEIINAQLPYRINYLVSEIKVRLSETERSKITIVDAAMRRLVNLIYGLLKSEVPFDEKLT